LWLFRCSVLHFCDFTFCVFEDLQLTIKTLTGEIDTLKSEIVELNLNLKRGWRSVLGRTLNILTSLYEKAVLEFQHLEELAMNARSR